MAGLFVGSHLGAAPRPKRGARFAAVGFFAVAVPFIGFTLAGLILVFSLLSAVGPKTPRALVLHGVIAGVAVGLVTFFFTGVMGVMLPGWAL